MHSKCSVGCSSNYDSRFQMKKGLKLETFKGLAGAGQIVLQRLKGKMEGRAKSRQVPAGILVQPLNLGLEM